MCADDGAIWKRVSNASYVSACIQAGIKKVEKLTIDWSFRMSASKSCYMVFSRKWKALENIQFLSYGKTLERVHVFKYLG